jgi:hypothetical protein
MEVNSPPPDQNVQFLLLLYEHSSDFSPSVTLHPFLISDMSLKTVQYISNVPKSQNPMIILYVMLKNTLLHNIYIFSRLLFSALLSSCNETYFLNKSHSVQLTLAYEIEISFLYRISKAFVMTRIAFNDINVQTMNTVMENRLV